MSEIIARRSFLTGLASMLAAPAIVHAGNLMPVHALWSAADVVWQAQASDDGVSWICVHDLKKAARFYRVYREHKTDN